MVFLATCNRCGNEEDLWEIILRSIADSATQEAIRSALELPLELSDPVFRYMRLFGGIRQPTYARLLGELTTAIKAGKFSYKKRDYSAPPALWLAALADTLSSATVSLPLKANHNYMLSIAADKANKRAELQSLRQEEQLRQGVRPNPPAPQPDDRQIKRRRLVEDVAHWRKNAELKPGDPSILAILEKAESALADFDSHP